MLPKITDDRQHVGQHHDDPRELITDSVRRNIIKGVIVTNDQNVLWIRLSSNERWAL